MSTWKRELAETGRWVGLRVFLPDDRLGARARAAQPVPTCGISLAQKYLLGKKISDNPDSETFETDDRKFSVRVFRDVPVARMLDILEICEKIGNFSAAKIVLPVDVFFTSNRWVLVEPLADTNAWKFFQQNSDNKFSELRVLLWAILSALAVVHSHGIVHGNIRPEAFLRIGNSWSLGSLHHPFACAGNYRAPEILVDPSNTSPGADLFALGISILEISAHKRWASDQASVDELLRRALTVDVRKILATDGELADPVETLLHLNPEKRRPDKKVHMAEPVSEKPRRSLRQPTKFLVAVQDEEDDEEVEETVEP